MSSSYYSIIFIYPFMNPLKQCSQSEGYQFGEYTGRVVLNDNLW